MPHRRAAEVLAALIVGGLVLSVGTSLAADRAAGNPYSEVILSGLDWPVAIDFAPDGRIFYAERLTGQVRIIKDGSLLPAPFYTLTDTVTDGEQGLLGLALHPDFPTEPWVYAYHTFDDPDVGGYNRIVRIQAEGDVGNGLEVVLDSIPAAIIHDGGVIGFGPDGMLFAVAGDAAGPANSQDLLSRAGKVLRMTPDGGVPPDNPFVGDASADPYVFTYGHRNMFGLAFHPETGRPYVSENGPACNDEVNLLVPGSNYAWGPRQSCAVPPDPPENTNRDGPDPVMPMFWWGAVVAPTNAVVYSGDEFPAWEGDLIVGQWNTRRLERLDLSPPDYDAVASAEVVHTAPSNIVDVDVGPDGAIWFTTPDAIYRLTDRTSPVARFTSSSTNTLVNETVDFDATGSFDPDGTIVSYAWGFGDGAMATGVTAAHAYAEAGLYKVTLTVTDSDGLSDSMSSTVTVRAPPVASFVVSASTALIDETITFDASASRDPDGTIASYDWDFGDEAHTTGVVVSHAYSERGTFAVTLMVTDDEGLSSNTMQTLQVVSEGVRPTAGFHASPSNPVIGETVYFVANSSFDSDGQIVSYSWDFGDGDSGSGFSTEHAYRSEGVFDVTLTVEDNDGLENVSQAQVIINDRPVASFSVTTSQSFIGVPIAFDARGSSDSDGHLVSFAWDFGDGASASGPRVDHAYSAKGTFMVRLMVVDDRGAVGSAERMIEIGNRGPSIVARLPGGEPIRLAVGEAAVLSVLATDADGDVVSYAWYLDGSPWVVGASAVRFREDTPGTYIVLLRVSDGDLEAVAEWTVNVEPTLEPFSSPWGSAGLLIGAGVLAAFVGLFIWLRGRARRRRPL